MSVSLMIFCICLSLAPFVCSQILSLIFWIQGRNDLNTQYREYWLGKNYPRIFPSYYRKYRKRIAKENVEEIRRQCEELGFDPDTYIERYFETGNSSVVQDEILKRLHADYNELLKKYIASVRKDV